jgi:hypothetical protein
MLRDSAKVFVSVAVAGSGDAGFAGCEEEEKGFAGAPELKGLLEELKGFAPPLEKGFALEALPRPLAPNSVSPRPGPLFSGSFVSSFFSSLDSCLGVSSFHTLTPRKARMLPSLRRQASRRQAKT